MQGVLVIEKLRIISVGKNSFYTSLYRPLLADSKVTFQYTIKEMNKVMNKSNE
jgi:hypothetical protein